MGWEIRLKILVTVGSTPFNELFHYLDLFFPRLPMTYQTFSEKKFRHPSFLYFNDFNSVLSEYDVVISHCGAGSVFKFLEARKTCLFVVNTERSDTHQIDIAKYVEANNYGLVAFSLSEIPLKLIKLLGGYKSNFYQVDKEFDGHYDVIDMLER
jgi:beta-1,4-N-acetylglucosaminyltransferase